MGSHRRRSIVSTARRWPLELCRDMPSNGGIKSRVYKVSSMHYLKTFPFHGLLSSAIRILGRELNVLHRRCTNATGYAMRGLL